MRDALPCFPREGLAFLRALKRHNDRDWFRSRRDDYERFVRAPVVAIVERLREDLEGIAPGLVADPRRSLYRIYRDTRFSEDKSPLKTHVAAVFPPRALPKHEAAGLYFEIAPDGVWMGGGLYAPQTAQLQLIREHLAENFARLRSIVRSHAFRGTVGEIYGERLQRVPRGFPRDHAAAEFLRFRQFLAGREEPAALAASPAFYPELLRTFRAVAPLVRFLNEPLQASGRRPGLRDRA